MDTRISRRKFLEAGSVTTAGIALATGNSKKSYASDNKKVRIGIVGTGNRGCSLLTTMLHIEGVEFPALCDINTTNLARCAGHSYESRPCKGRRVYRR